MINKKLLKPCDILLFRTTHRSTIIDRAIVWGQKTFYHAPKNARYCHVALVDKNTDLMLEAVWPKTHITPIDFSTYKEREQIEVYRVKDITEEQIDVTLKWAYNHVGEWYDVPLLLTGWIDIKHAEVCSTYVSHSFEDAGLEIPSGSKGKRIVLPDSYYCDILKLEHIVM